MSALSLNQAKELQSDYKVRFKLFIFEYFTYTYFSS